MWRYFTSTNSKKYIDVLQQIVESYDKSFHSIKMGRSDANFDSASKGRLEIDKKVKNIPKRSVKYSVGNLVRLSTGKMTFRKGYESGWSEEIFKIRKISS